MRARPTRWCVLISGRGSNMAALIEKPGVDVRLVATSEVSAPGVAKALRAGIPVLNIPKKESGAIDWARLDLELRRRSIDAIFLLGFMRIVPKSFVENWTGRILNLHPSLLPSYPGLRSIERAMEADDDVGVTVHEAVAAVDAGPILRSRKSIQAGARSAGRAVSSLFVHIDEQRIVKETVEAWRP